MKDILQNANLEDVVHAMDRSVSWTRFRQIKLLNLKGGIRLDHKRQEFGGTIWWRLALPAKPNYMLDYFMQDMIIQSINFIFIDTFYVFSLVAAHTWVAIESWILNRLLKCRSVFPYFQWWYDIGTFFSFHMNQVDGWSGINLKYCIAAGWSVPTLITITFVIVKSSMHPNSCWLYIGSETIWVWFAPEIFITSFLLTQDRSTIWLKDLVVLRSLCEAIIFWTKKFLEVVFRLLYLRLRTLLAKSHFKNKKLKQKDDHSVLQINKNMRSVLAMSSWFGIHMILTVLGLFFFTVEITTMK